MNKALIFILLPLLFMSCSHMESRANVPDSVTKNIEKSDRIVNPAKSTIALVIKRDTRSFYPVSKKVITPTPVIKSILTTDDAVLDKSRKDIRTFYVTARHLRMSSMAEDLELFAEVAEEYIRKRIDPLLKDRMMNHSPEVKRALTEIQFYKAHLQYEIKDLESACETVSGLESSRNHESGEDLEIINQRFGGISNPYLVMADFSDMCK